MSKVGKQIIAGLEEAVTMTEIMELFKGTKLDRLRAIAKAERDGRVVVLPCKVGETVYVVENKRCDDGSSFFTVFDIYEYPFSLDLFHHLFGRKFYITRQEAEAALSEKIRHTEELRAKICGYYYAAGKGE